MARRGSRRTVRVVVVAGVAPFGLVLGAVPAFATTPTPVIHTDLQEELPAGGGGYVFWTQNSADDPNHYDLFGKKTGQPRFQVNADNTFGFTGAVDGPLVLYQQTNSARTQSDLFIYNLDTKARTKLPAAVNTDDWEFYASMSGDFIAFTRQNLHTFTKREFLYNRSTHDLRQLDTAPSGNPALQTGQVNGNFVVWQKCDAQGKCTVFEYDIEHSKKTRIPGPQGKSQHSPAVTTDGTVFFGRSGIGCGTNASVVEDPPDGPQKVLFSLPAGVDFSRLNVVIGAHPTAVLFDRVRCDPLQFDIYRFTA